MFQEQSSSFPATVSTEPPSRGEWAGLRVYACHAVGMQPHRGRLLCVSLRAPRRASPQDVCSCGKGSSRGLGSRGGGQESPGLPSANWRPRTPVGTSPSRLKAGRGQGRCTLRLQQKADSSFPASLSCPGLGGLGDATHPPRRGPRALIWPPAQGVSSGNTHRHSWALFACCLGIPWPGRVDTKNNHPRCVTREASTQVPVPNSPVCCGLLSCAHGLRPHSVSKGFSGVGPPSQRFIFASGGQATLKGLLS